MKNVSLQMLQMAFFRRLNFYKLQIQQNKFLRRAGNYRKYTEINKMHRDLNIQTVFNYVKCATAKNFDKIAGHKNPLIRNLATSTGRHKNIKHILKENVYVFALCWFFIIFSQLKRNYLQMLN